LEDSDAHHERDPGTREVDSIRTRVRPFSQVRFY